LQLFHRKARKKTNLVQSRKLLELLDAAVKKYQNKLLSSTEVIEELIKLAKDIKKADQRGEELGLSVHELAFYDALSQNESARDVMGQINSGSFPPYLWKGLKAMSPLTGISKKT